jgi:hypothetical protein
MSENQRDLLNEVYAELIKDLDSMSHEEFYADVNNPISPISTPLDVKVKQAKIMIMQVEKNLEYEFGDKQFIKVEFEKSYPKDVIEAVAMIYEDQDWYVSPRRYFKPYKDNKTGKTVFSNIIINANPIPIQVDKSNEKIGNESDSDSVSSVK